MINILFLNPAGYIGGAEKSLIDLVIGLPRDRFRPLVVTMGPGPLTGKLDRRGIETREILLPPVLLNLSRSQGGNRLMAMLCVPVLLLPPLYLLLRLIRVESVEIIHTNGMKAHLLGCVLTLLSRRTLIWHFRDYLPRGRYQRLFQLLGKIFPEKIIANSRKVKESLGNLSKITVVYNGISLLNCNDALSTFKKELGWSNGDLVIGTVGHFAPLKGYEDLLAAAVEVLKFEKRARFVIVGGAPYPAFSGYRERIIDSIDRMGLAGKVVCPGSRDDLTNILGALDIFVLPSWSEGFGRANLEAMAAGKPVVSTNIGGIPEVVGDGETGYLVPPHNPAVLAEAIVKLAQDQNLRDTMGRSGIEKAKRFSIGKMINGVLKVYYEVMG